MIWFLYLKYRRCLSIIHSRTTKIWFPLILIEAKRYLGYFEVRSRRLSAGHVGLLKKVLPQIDRAFVSPSFFAITLNVRDHFSDHISSVYINYDHGLHGLPPLANFVKLVRPTEITIWEFNFLKIKFTRHKRHKLCKITNTHAQVTQQKCTESWEWAILLLHGGIFEILRCLHFKYRTRLNVTISFGWKFIVFIQLQDRIVRYVMFWGSIINLHIVLYYIYMNILAFLASTDWRFEINKAFIHARENSSLLRLVTLMMLNIVVLFLLRLV